MANFVGFNIDTLKASIKGINDSYGELEAVMQGQMQNSFINVMAEKWACNHATSYFAMLKERVDDLLNKSYMTFQSVNGAMNAAGLAWDETTHSGLYTEVTFDYAVKTVDVSCIQENIGGERGIDPTALDEANTLRGFIDLMKAALDKAQVAVQECGFLGGDTAGTLQQSIASIRTTAENVGETLISEFDRLLKQTLEEYGNISATVTSNLEV